MSRVVLDHDDVRRTLMRIAHEIVEKNPDGRVALVGIHRRGAVLAKRLHTLTSELLDSEVPLGSVDIAFYRDDLSIRPSAPIVHATQLDFPVQGRTIVIVDDVLYTGRTVRPDYIGKNIPTSVQERVTVRVEEVDGVDEVTIGPAPERKREAA